MTGINAFRTSHLSGFGSNASRERRLGLGLILEALGALRAAQRAVLPARLQYDTGVADMNPDKLRHAHQPQADASLRTELTRMGF